MARHPTTDLGTTTSMRTMISVRRCRDLMLTVAVNAVSAPPATFFYGGQAVIEGVLMRGRDRYAVAARRPNGEIAVCTDVLRSRVYTASVWRRPFLRGVAGLYETIHLGMRALQWSALVQLGQDAEIGEGAIRGAMIASLVFALALFIGAPLLLGKLLHRGASQSITRRAHRGRDSRRDPDPVPAADRLDPECAPAVSVPRRRAHGDQRARVRRRH